MMHHGGNTIIADQHSFFLQEMYGPTSFPTIYLLQEPKKLHSQHPVKEQLLAVSWCSCHNFNVCNTQWISNIYCSYLCILHSLQHSFVRFKDTSYQKSTDLLIRSKALFQCLVHKIMQEHSRSDL
jgi:hypothetical protein